MGHLASLLLLAGAISLDSFGVGMTYGLRKVRIPVHSILIIAICSALSLFLGMTAGSLSGQVMAGSWAGKIGGIILFTLGVWTASSYFKKNEEPDLIYEERTILQFEIKSIGLVIQLLKKPLKADFDQSGTITGFEALFLGAALSLDGFGAGIGAGILGYSPAILVGASLCMCALFLYFGIKTGASLMHSWMAKVLSFIPGLVLMLLGLYKIFQ